MISGELVGSYNNKAFNSPDMAVDALIRDMENFETRVIPTVVKTSMEKYLRLIAGRLAAKHNQPWKAGGTNNNLYERSGKGMRSVIDSVEVIDAGKDVLGKIGGLWYLRTQETGAVIRAKRSQYLTIPLPAALDQRGVPLKRRARDWAHTFIKKSRNGNLLIFQKTARGIIPLYVLKKQVRIPKRLGMEAELKRYQNLFFSFIEAGLQREFKL